MSSINLALIKYGLLIATAPIWYPFLKAIWQELNNSLRSDGGVFGKLPTHRDRAELDQVEFEEEDPLVSEPHRRPGDSRHGQQAPRGPLSESGAPGRAGGKLQRPDPQRTRGFR